MFQWVGNGKMVEPGQISNPWTLYYAAGLYSADVIGVEQLPVGHPKNKTDEEQLLFLLRPHKSMWRVIREEFDKIPIEDKEKRYGDFPKKIYPKRLLKTVGLDPEYLTLLIMCDFDGNETTRIGLADEQYTVQLRSALTNAQSTELELAKNKFLFRKFVEQKGVIEDIKREIRLTVANEIRLALAKKEKDKD